MNWGVVEPNDSREVRTNVGHVAVHDAGLCIRKNGSAGSEA